MPVLFVLLLCDSLASILFALTVFGGVGAGQAESDPICLSLPARVSAGVGAVRKPQSLSSGAGEWNLRLGCGNSFLLPDNLDATDS